MTAYTQVENDVLVSRGPCKLLSITITNTGSGDGTVEVYDSRSANSADKAITLMVGSKETRQFRWEGLEFNKGLFVDNVEKVECLTIEWEALEC